MVLDDLSIISLPPIDINGTGIVNDVMKTRSTPIQRPVQVPILYYLTELPQSLVYIGKNVFSVCNNLRLNKDKKLPPGLTHIDEDAFNNCNGIKANIETLPIGLTYIGKNVFSGCTKLDAKTTPHAIIVSTYAVIIKNLDHLSNINDVFENTLEVVAYVFKTTWNNINSVNMGFLKTIMSSSRENIESLQFIITIQTNISTMYHFIMLRLELDSLTSTNELFIQKQKTHPSIFLYVKVFYFWAFLKHD